ncbi:hypothetical protein GCM10020331_004560 [Ectobacillus funiculus]
MVFIGVLLTSEHKWGLLRKYGTVVSVVVAISSYLAAGFIHASGFMATFTAGLISGNPQVFRFQVSEETNSTVFQFFRNSNFNYEDSYFFMLLGTQVDFSYLESVFGYREF